MALGDAFQALYLQQYASQTTAFLSWNARHFRQKLSLSVLTPEEWLSEQFPDTDWRNVEECIRAAVTPLPRLRR